MLPGLVVNSADATAAAAAAPPQQLPQQPQASVAVEFSEEERGIRFEGERSSGWPRQETLALIKIRSDMDFAFREATSKGPLWDEVSRKLGELGYHRSGKKCKEKFENVYKYHKRTKEGRTSKADGKTYRFFDQLEALEANLGSGGGGGGASHTTPPPSMAAAGNISTVPSVAIPFGSHPNNNVSPISVAAPAVAAMPHVGGGFPFARPNASVSTNTTSSSNSSDDEPPELRKKRKRKWKDFFGRLMKEVIHKQEELQTKFLDQIEKRERERMAREEAWRMEEMAKMNREHDMLVHERSVAAAKDAAVITFLQKITEQNPNAAVPQILQNQPPPQPETIQQPQLQNQQPPQAQTIQQQELQPPSAPVPPPPQPQPQHQFQVVKSVENISGGELVKASRVLSPSPSRWPKAEVNALINLRTTLDMKYQDSGPKGPLWEEISAGMLRLGYNRNAKRCKEKWENINKYYKKVKESSKKRPQDSKTCPYFHQLDAIYRQKANNNNNNPSSRLLPESSTQMEAIMAEPEQQWPLPAMVQQQQSTIHHENVDQNNEDDYEDEDEDEEEEDEGGEYEIVSNKNSSSSMGAVRVTEA